MSTIQIHDDLDDSGVLYAEDLIDNGFETDEDREARVKALRSLYEQAKSAKVGSQIRCPACGRMHTKTTYHKVFCTNQKTVKRGSGSCKDAYWNHVGTHA